MDTTEAPSYIDYETFLDPTFSATSFANTLVLATNNPSDSPIDLSTPLSKVLFDVQEVDTHIDNLTRKSAVPLLEYTRDHVQSGDRILQELETQVAALSGSYERLEREVIRRYEAAEEVRLVAERLWRTVRLGRAVGRCLVLGRQLETQMADARGGGPGAVKREDYRALVRGANTVLGLRGILSDGGPGREGEGLDRIVVIRSLRSELMEPAERSIIARSEQVVGQFSMSTLTTASTSDETGPGGNLLQPATYAQIEDTRSRATSALVCLYLLSPAKPPSSPRPTFEPELLTSVLQEYLRRAITSSLAGMSAGLAALPKLDRALLEVSARCQNIVALEMLLESIKPPPHPLLMSSHTGEAPAAEADNDGKSLYAAPDNLLKPLLASLDTSSLPSYFWRSMASQLSARVTKIVRDGGVSARTLRSNKDRVRDAIRQCVDRGSQLSSSSLSRGRGAAAAGNWEREAAVMVGSVMNVLGK